jgi:tRNA modification GTPase
MRDFSPDDTIVAVATPPGRGGIGVVRLSGPLAVRIAATLTGRAEFEPRRATLARVHEDAGGAPRAAAEAIDEVIVTWFSAPQSYTGEDVVEISGHGSPPVQARLVGLAMQAGARLAAPGEFTLRAYLHGRLDLIQAEAVADLVEAVTPLQARAAMDQLEGTLTTRIRQIDATLLDLTARLEASLDFPDEGFHFVTREVVRAEVAAIRRDLEALASDGRGGRVVREGRLVVIVGPPNAGKSSLFNALVGASRAIVTAVPGTTRDALTERVDVGGLAITLVDTAGLRDTIDPIEVEGVARSRQARQVAALAVLVLDQSEPLTADARALVAEASGPQLLVLNKADQPHAWAATELGEASRYAVTVSAVTGLGLAHLRARLVRELCGREEWRDPPMISNVRHVALVDEARLALERAEAAIAAGATEELVITDVADARRALEAITGRRTPDDVLQHIFARFCVGK